MSGEKTWFILIVFLNHMQIRFVLPKRDAMQLFKLYDMLQKVKKSAHAYVKQVRVLCNKIDEIMKDPVKVEHFITRLLSTYKKTVLSHSSNMTTFTTAINITTAKKITLISISNINMQKNIIKTKNEA